MPTAAVAATTAIVPATDPRIAWTGRTQHLPDDAIRFAFPGVSLSLRVQAARVILHVTASSADCWFDLELDYAAPRTLLLPAGEAEVVIADHLDPLRDHRIKLIRRIESWMGVVTVHAVRTAGGVLLPADPAPDRRLLFIGDSITCGACVDYLPPDWPEGNAMSNANGSYGMVLARRLNAQAHLISYGGRGLQRDYQGWGNERTANAPLFFERTLADDPTSVWDHASYQPHGIIIGLGTNDFNQGIPDREAWIPAYICFIARLRAVYPAARILLLTSPLIGQRVDNGDAQKSAALAGYIAEIVRRCSEAGERRLSWLALPHLPGARNSHPDAHGHQRIADLLAPELATWFAPGIHQTMT